MVEDSIFEEVAFQYLPLAFLHLEVHPFLHQVLLEVGTAKEHKVVESFALQLQLALDLNRLKDLQSLFCHSMMSVHNRLLKMAYSQCFYLLQFQLVFLPSLLLQEFSSLCLQQQFYCCNFHRYRSAEQTLFLALLLTAT